MKLKTASVLLLVLSFFGLTIINSNPASAVVPGQNGRIAYDFGVNIYTAEPDGTDANQITSSNTDLFPKWSPDGTKIAFISLRDGTYEIYVMDADGSNQTRLTTSSGLMTQFHQYPDWSPDGSKILYTDANLSAVTSKIAVMDADGSNKVELTDGSYIDTFPTWSPDGTKILFTSNRDEADPGLSELYTMDPDGSNVTRITNRAGADMYGSWSPDGSKIIFSSDEGGGYNLYTVNPDGSGLSALMSLAANEEARSGAYWSPDGSKIIFTLTIDEGLETRLKIMDSNGSNIQDLIATAGGTNDFTGFSWQTLGAITDPGEDTDDPAEDDTAADEDELAETGFDLSHVLILSSMILAILLIASSRKKLNA